jgi:hypothetical protein
MKTSHAIVIIVVCVAIAIIGLYGLMNTKIVVPDSSVSQQTTHERYSAVMAKDIGEDRHQSISLTPFVPLILSIIIFIIGLLGSCYGFYSLATTTGHRTPKSPIGG